MPGKLTVRVGKVHYFEGAAGVIMCPEAGRDVYQTTEAVRDLLDRVKSWPKNLTIATNSRDVIDQIALDTEVETVFILHRDGLAESLTMTAEELAKAIRVAGVDFRRL